MATELVSWISIPLQLHVFVHQDFCTGCQCFVPSKDLETDHPPYLDVANSGFVAEGVLQLVIWNSAKYFDTTIDFKDSINGTCNYPIASVGITWNVTFDPVNCIYIYTVQIPLVCRLESMHVQPHSSK